MRLKGWEKITMQIGMKKKAGVAIIIFEKTDFKMKATTRDNRGDYIILKRSIQKEDISLVNIYTPNIEAPKYIPILLEDFKGEIDRNTVNVGNFNTPLTSLDRSPRYKFNKETETLNGTLE
uniref:Uncharacterized protein n=1 Tax=Myotis myotis TaxID=51298 RepID=A0A7J7Z4T2_MYOMY|nr:hypothetical protein mMyoMyo1_010544 [Myotis myotis]